MEALVLGQSEKFTAVALAQIEIEEDQVNGLLSKDLESLFNRPAVGSNIEPWLCPEKPTYALSK